ncbi:MAG TPA: ABC transporter permease [Acidimicrobiia bacterium]
MRDTERSGATRAVLPALAAIRPADALAVLVPVAVLFIAVRVWPWPAPLGVLLDGALAGGRIALVALGIALIYRANRVINFAQGDLGTVPATLVVMLIISTGINYFLAVAAGLAAAIVLGVLVETLIIRRFFRAPRLILTVATIGLSQVLVGAALYLPEAFGETALQQSRLEPPFTLRFDVAGTIFNGNDVIAMVVIPAAFVAMALWLNRSATGIAVRAGAERADRAATLGIPVRRLHTVVWVVATVLAFAGMFLRAGAVGLPLGSVLGPVFLLQALAAVVIGRMDRFTTIAAAAIGLGILDRSMTFQDGNDPAFNYVVLFVVVLLALLLVPRPAAARVAEGEVSTWQAVREVRPIPRELAGLWEVRLIRFAALAVVAGVLLTVPVWLSDSRTNLAAVIVLFGIIGLSLVVLTGWGGQVSLGQMGFVGVGAAVGGAITDRSGWDLSLAVLAAGVAGAAVAVVVGYPAIRRRGLTLAVSTLAFGLFVWAYALNREFFEDLLPAFRIDRPDVFGVVDVTTETRFYYLTLVALLLALVVVLGLRRSRTGRALIAIRENERAARAYGIDATRTSLAGFAISGFLAAFAGALLVHQHTGLLATTYAPEESLQVFSMVVIGGLGSIPGALLGAAYVRSVDFFLPLRWQFLATGGGLLLVLMILPSGLGSVIYDVRDWLLRRIAARRQLLVPSLVADRREPEPALSQAAASEAVEEAAERAPAELSP